MELQVRMPPRRVPRLLAVGSGGNRFVELLAEAKEIRNRTGQDWDTLAGISAGALLCGLISMQPMDDLNTFNTTLARAIAQFGSDASASPFTPWLPLGGFVSALFAVLFQKPAVFQGNAGFLRKEFDEAKFHAAGRRLLVGVYDNVLEKYKTVDSRFHSPSDMRQAIAASSAVPGVVPPVAFQGHRCRDGGVVHTIPINEIIAFVRQHGRSGPVHVDLLISGNIASPPHMSSTVTVTSSLMDLCGSLVWQNLQRDLRSLVRQLLVDAGSPPYVQRKVLQTLVSGAQRNFQRPWGTLRVVSAEPWTAKQRPIRTQFRARVPAPTMAAMVANGRHAAEKACETAGKACEAVGEAAGEAAGRALREALRETAC